MGFVNFVINFQLKLKKNRLQFIFLFLFWLAGFIFFFVHEAGQDFLNIFLLSLTIRTLNNAGDFVNFFSLVWPILLEVIVFGFFMGELLEKYNPLITSKILAQHQRNHTVIIGFQHLSERIIEFCIENKKSFSIIEDNLELVEDLLNSSYPVVVGDPTDSINLNNANIKRAKEVFICIDDARIAIICTEKIRRINRECPIYVRAFENHLQEYLRQEPLNAYSFSTSKWAMEVVHGWTNNKKGDALVIGRDYLTHRIAHHISLQPERQVYLFDDKNDGIEFEENSQLHIINDLPRYLSDLNPHVNFEKISQVFICWTQESDFDEALYLTSKINLRFPKIEIFVRIYDEELIDLVRRYNAQTFSSSAHAFKMLQKEVKPGSSISPN